MKKVSRNGITELPKIEGSDAIGAPKWIAKMGNARQRIVTLLLS
jgi:hypothetical protein